MLLRINSAGETVFISILVRNKAHILPYFLKQLYTQTYTKNRMVLHSRVDHRLDASLAVLNTWLEDISPGRKYHNIIREVEECKDKA